MGTRWDEKAELQAEMNARRRTRFEPEGGRVTDMGEEVPRIEVYKIGGGPRPGKHWAHRWHVDRWFRSWQAEWDSALWCPRSWTSKMVRRKALRWMRRNTDLARHEQRYGTNLVVRAMRGL